MTADPVIGRTDSNTRELLGNSDYEVDLASDEELRDDDDLYTINRDAIALEEENDSQDQF